MKTTIFFWFAIMAGVGVNQKKRFPTLIILEVMITAALALAVFAPKQNLFASLNYLRLIAAFITISLVMFIIVLKSKQLIFPKLNQLLIFLPYVLYLTLRALFSTDSQDFMMGNSDRQLGLLTSVACYFFFISGLVLVINSKPSVLRILVLIFAMEIAYISTTFWRAPVPAKSGSFYNINFLSVFLSTLSIVIVTRLMQIPQKSKVKSFSILLLCITFILLLAWNGSTQGLAAFFVTFLIYLASKHFQLLLKVPNFLLIFLSCLFIFFILFIMLMKLPQVSIINGTSFYERLEIYKTSLRIVGHNIFFGTGIDNFNAGYFRYNFSNNLKLVDNAHSVPLQLLSTVGVIGFALWIFVPLKALTGKNGADEPLFLSLKFGLFSYLVSSLAAIQVPGTEFLMFFICGALLSPHESQLKISRIQKLILLTPLIFLVLYALNSFLNYNNQTRILSNFRLGYVSNYRDIRVLEKVMSKEKDLALLFNESELAIASGDEGFGIKVAHRMIALAPEDQRTIAAVLRQAERWNDSGLANLGAKLEREAKG